MLRKGSLEEGLGEIILLFLTTSVIAGVMLGPLGAKMGEGFQEAQRFTNVEEEVTINNSETFGELAHYVFWRAWNCNELESWTFQSSKLKEAGLVDENGQGLCAGASSTAAKGFGELITGDSGQDMEGKYSRVEFEINQTFTLKTGKGFGRGGGSDYGDSAVLLGVGTGYSAVHDVNVNDKHGLQEYSSWIAGGCTDYGWRGYSWYDPDHYLENPANKGPPYSTYTFFFENGPSDERVNRVDDGETFDDRYVDLKDRVRGSEWLFCNRAITGTSPLAAPREEYGFEPEEVQSYEGADDSHVEVQLCKGDKGYIETRKKKPTSEGESGKNIAWKFNDDNLYGIIQITDKSQDCG